MELFPERLYLEVAYHGNPREKLLNRALRALAQKLDLPLVATNAVRYARLQDAQAAVVLDSMRRNRRAEATQSRGADTTDLPIVGLESAMAHAQAYLRSPAEMHRLFGQLRHALAATVEIRDRVHFRLPLSRDQPADERYGPALLFGLGPALDIDRHRLVELVHRTLGERFTATGRGTPSDDVVTRAEREVADLCRAGLAELMLTAHDLARFCHQHGMPLAARGSATSSLVAWCLELVELRLER